MQLETNEKQIRESMKVGIISKDELKKALTKEDLTKATGGYIFEIYHGFEDFEDWSTYEVIDDNTGNVLKDFDNLQEAWDYARSVGMSGERINWPTLNALREKASKQ